MTMGSILKRVRILRHLTQKQLAHKVGVTESAIRNYELGIRQPNERQLSCISEVLNVSPAFFYFEECESSELMILCLMKYSRNFLIEFDENNTTPYIKITGKNNLSIRLVNLLIEWEKKKEELSKNSISSEEYETWLIDSISSTHIND